MGVSSSTDMVFSGQSEKFAFDALNLLLQNNWHIKSYIDVGDIDDFNHIYLDGDFEYEKVLQVFQEKELRGETPYAYLFQFHEEQRIGGDFFFEKQKKMIYIGWNNGEKKTISQVERYNTDFSWYTEKLLVPFQNTNFNVIHIQHQDTDLF